MNENASGSGVSGPVPLLGIAAELLRHRGRLFRLLAAGVVFVTAHWAVAPRQYSARAVFSPEVDLRSISGAASLSTLAARFGLGNPAGATPLPFYPELVGSETFLARLVRIPFADTVLGSSDAHSTTLLDLYSDSSEELPERIRRAADEVVDRTITSLNRDANTITIAYTADDPVLAALVANAYVSLINDFNVNERRSRAKALRLFLESEAVPRAAAELKATEDSLAAFYTQNRRLEGSPALRLEESRWQRRIALKQQSYVDLANQLENARVDEIQDTPVITVVSPASPPVEPASPRLLINLPVMVIMVISVWLLWVIGLWFFRIQSTLHPQSASMFRSEVGQISSRLRVLLWKPRRSHH